MSFRARSSSSLRALPFSFWAYTSSVHRPRGEHRQTDTWDGQNETSSRKRQNNTVRWRTIKTNFNMSEQAISTKSWLEPWHTHNFQAHFKSSWSVTLKKKLHPQNPMLHALTCRLLIHWMSKVSESPHQKQMTCSSSPPKDTRSICQKRTLAASNVSIWQPALICSVFPLIILVYKTWEGISYN